jgi:hypothetical protein
MGYSQPAVARTTRRLADSAAAADPSPAAGAS